MMKEDLQNKLFYMLNTQDYYNFMGAFNSGDTHIMHEIGYKNLSKYRELFFASLNLDMCDIRKAKNFHMAYKIYEEILTIMSKDMIKSIEVKYEHIKTNQQENNREGV